MKTYVKIGKPESQHDNGGHSHGPQSYGCWVRIVRENETGDGYLFMPENENAGTVPVNTADEIAKKLSEKFGGLPIVKYNPPPTAPEKSRAIKHKQEGLIMEKIDAVEYIIKNSESVRDWLDEIGVNPADIDHNSARIYGTGGHGDIADSIIRSGIEDGLINRDETDGFFPAIRNIFTSH